MKIQRPELRSLANTMSPWTETPQKSLLSLNCAITRGVVGHFAAMEQPRLWAGDVAAFFSGL